MRSLGYAHFINLKQTGYSMTAVAGPVMEASNHIAEQANMYETNDNE